MSSIYLDELKQEHEQKFSTMNNKLKNDIISQKEEYEKGIVKLNYNA